MKLFAVFLSFAIVHTISAQHFNPLKDSKICGRPQCDVRSKKFGYTDKIYKYEYKVDLTTEFSGTGDNKSSLLIKANLELFFPKSCEGYLRIRDIKLWNRKTDGNGADDSSSEANPISASEDDDYYGEFSDMSNLVEADGESLKLHPKSSDLASNMEKYLLRFAFNDGLISEVCPDPNETVWVLNFKKGILSAIQNTMLRFDIDFNTTESDITGHCNVHYKLENTDGVFIKILKTKDITTCRNRYSTHSVLQTTPYTFRDDKTIWPILNSKSYCNMTIGNNIYKEVKCYERHQLIPFSNRSNGATTISTSQLTYNGDENYSIGEFLAENDELIEKRSSLHFDHTPAIKPTHGEIKAARELLKEMCAFGFPNIQRNFIEIFTNFLHTAKSLNYKALTQLLARSASICENGRNHILDSLPFIKSTASYQLMRDQIIASTLPKSVVTKWMTTLSFIQRPDEETLETFYTIIDFSQAKVYSEYTLCASAVVHSYCRHNSDCFENARVQRIVNLLEQEFLKIIATYRGERQKYERMVVILKGLGNIGLVDEYFAERLLKIITEDEFENNLRIQAVMTFRRIDCPKYRQIFLNTYANNSIPSEIRIASYLQAMICPNYQSIDFIKKVLNSEKVNQVGSFVWSHLKGLTKSSSPVHIEVQSLLLDNGLPEKFRMDIRKFSRNYEYSVFFDEYNLGAASDINLIFGTESYVPRTLNFNFTVDLFGQSVNLFELSARAEGFEQLIASIFGTKGPLNRGLFRNTLVKINQWLGNESLENDNLENLLDLDKFRLKRSIARNKTEPDYFNDEGSMKENSQASSFEKNIDDLGYKLKYNYNYPRAEVGIRVFGNDLRYYTMEGMIEVMAMADNFDLLKLFSKTVSHKDVIYTKSNVFLDASYNVPLITGLPLSITAFGASSVDFRLSGRLQQNNSAKWFFDVEGKLKPSVSVDLIITMESDVFYSQTGIKVKSNLYTNSEVEALLKVRGIEVISLSLNLPQDRNEVFSARSELLVLNNNEDIPQPGIKQRTENSTCTWPVLDKAIGLKMCSYYSVPNISHSENITYPELILSGPVDFSVLLIKSDLSAKRFLFEYLWNKNNNNSNWSFVFNTPGSVVPRLLVANVTTISEGHNISVLFKNGPNEVSAGCRTLSYTDYKSFAMFLDTNGNRSLDLIMELRRQQDRIALLYKPKVLLAVNGVNITGLIGTIRVNEKNGITQNDIDLSLETRKLQLLLRGNVVKNEITTSTNMTINYRFQANKVETINFEGKLSNTGDKSKTEYRGNVKLKTTAYPKLNFVSNATWLSLQGHTEGVITHNNAPDLADPNYTNLVRLVFVRAYSEDQIWEGSRTHTSLDVRIPSSKIDFRVMLKYEERSKNGTEHNVFVNLRYAPKKEITGLFSILIPRRNLFAIDAYMNITVPDFNSCGAYLKINERATKDYVMSFNGSWFTDHSIALKGYYKDRSSRIQSLCHIKLIVESPSFAATTLNMIYRRNQVLIFGDIQAKHGNDPYRVTFQNFYQTEDKNNSNGELRLQIKEHEYWINWKLAVGQPKVLLIEIHLDTFRDIRIEGSLVSLDIQKRLLLEFQWDVNRDPSQRLGCLAEYNRVGVMRYTGDFMVTYPDRTVSAGFMVYTGGPKYYGTTRLSWNVNEMIELKYSMEVDPDKDIHKWIRIDINTPFDGWTKNWLTAGVYNVGNLLIANTSLFWADNNKLDVGYRCNFLFEDPLLSFDIRFDINSTLKDIPIINIKMLHFQNSTNLDTDLGLRYSAADFVPNIYNLKCKWELKQNRKFQNVSGIILVVTPFNGYRKGGLAAKLSLSDKREVQGAASLSLDMREFTLTMEGYIKKFTDSMLIMNITTPLEKYQSIHGRFGLNEYKRHAVAEVRAPSTALGVEVLCDIKSLMNFDITLSIATPIESFHEFAIFGKVHSDTIDLRGKLNNATVGFIGVWRVNNLTDFEYSYRVYTPLKGFEENGFIAKLVIKENIVMELHGKFSHYKLGVFVRGQPKSKLLKQLGNNIIELEILYDDDFNSAEIDMDDDYDLDEVNYDEFLSYYVEFGLDTLVLPTIEGVIDIQEIFDYYLVVGSMELPQGSVAMKNRLYFPDYLNILNVLNLNTPFEFAQTIKSVVEHRTDLSFKNIYEKMHLTIEGGKYDKNPVVLGLIGNYTYVDHAVKPREHNLKLIIEIPSEKLRQVDIEGKLELDDNIYRWNLSSQTPHSYMSLAASIEMEENFLDTTVGIVLDTHTIPNYSCRLHLKKDFSKHDNCFNINFELLNNTRMHQLRVDSAWYTGDIDQIINANTKFFTTLLPLKQLDCSIEIKKSPNPLMNFDISVLNQNETRIDYGTRANKKGDVFTIEIWTPIRNFRNISLHGTLTPSASNQHDYIVDGQLYRNMVTYALNGVLRLDANHLIDARLRVKPSKGGPAGVIDLRVAQSQEKKGSHGYDFHFNAIEDGKMCEISGRYSFDNTVGADLSLLVESTEPEISYINANAKLQFSADHTLGEISFNTPWVEFGMDKGNLRSLIAIQADNGKIDASYDIGNNIGTGVCSWTWILDRDIQLSLETYINHPNVINHLLNTSLAYLKPQKSYKQVILGSSLHLNSIWSLAVNSSLNCNSADDMRFDLEVQLPEPIGDVHHISGAYRGNLLSNKRSNPEIFLEGKYLSEEEQRNYIGYVLYKNATDLQAVGHIEWGVQNNRSVLESGVKMLRKSKHRREIDIKITLPKNKRKPAFLVKGNYDLLKDDYHKISCFIDTATSPRVAELDLAFQSLANLHGFVNSSMILPNVSWFKADFNFTTSGGERHRACRCEWPTDFATLTHYNKYVTQGAKNDVYGGVEIEIPLNTRHRVDVTYRLNEKQHIDTGHLKVIYNTKKLLNGTYHRLEEHAHPYYKDTTSVLLENNIKPLAVHYVSSQDLSDLKSILNEKHIELFELNNTRNFNFTGKLYTKTTPIGKLIEIKAIHSNRTATLSTNYEKISEKLINRAIKLQLSPMAWIGLNMQKGDYSTIGNDSQEFKMELFYPKRNLSIEGLYYMTQNVFSSDILLKWTGNFNSSNQKIIRTGFMWQAEPLKDDDRDHQRIMLRLGHPYLVKDITLKGRYYRGLKNLLKANLIIDYSNDPDHLIAVEAVLTDLCTQNGFKNYILKLNAQHRASEFDFDYNGTAIALVSYYKIESHSLYARQYFPDKKRMLLAMLDLNKKEIEYTRQSPYKTVRFWAIPTYNYPIYGINATVWDIPETNNSGYIYVDFHEKVARMDVKLTEDGSQNLQMFGLIPDSRSGYLDIWRNYEDIRIIDFASFLKMNHSRHITGGVHWRPKIKQELKDKVKTVCTAIYNSFSEDVDFWVKSLYTETVDIVGAVWETSKEHNKHFINDVCNLNVLGEDLDDFRTFLNKSYESDDFYIKTMVNFTTSILDELALRDHIDSLPKIFTEFWQMMGESGKTIRNNLVTLITTMKTTYNNLLEALNRIFHGESLQYLSNLLEVGMEKYDKFIKDMHISFIKNVEKLWNKFWNVASLYWKGILKRIEPHIFKLMSYIETTVWDLSKEIFDFIYKRTNELAESPYFNKVSSFTQNIDNLYKDLKSHDAITNIKKYSSIAWSFLRDKYFKLIPFGAELNEIIGEVWTELKELKKLAYVQFLLQKYNEISEKIEWIIDEFQLEMRFHQLYSVLLNKLRNYALNALESADMYREAKTKFIFDPENGLIDLEQKLPMSWHAFNETPKFDEIFEYKMIVQARKFFTETNASILRHVYNLRSHLDLKTWLPPYYSRAILIDYRHFMTFDKRFVKFNKPQCSYLLSHDYFYHNFTLILESSTNTSTSKGTVKKLYLIANNQSLEIDLTNNAIAVNGNHQPMLPFRIEDVIIYSDFNILSIHSENEFTLQCNMQFDLCWFEVSGWYFGQTAGILGIMNNEPFDELTSSQNTIVPQDNMEIFVDSWSTKTCRETKSLLPSRTAQTAVSEKINEACDNFFKSGVLSSCIDTVDPQPFYEMCLDLGHNSSVINSDHKLLKSACTSALAYIEACTFSKIPLRVPHQCIFCELSNGTYVPETTFIELSGENVPRSSDIVFIVEAKSCNINLTRSETIIPLLSTLEEQLQAHQISDNRYAVVTFGARSPPFNHPRGVTQENSVFVKDINKLQRYFSHVAQYIDAVDGPNPNNDVLHAISTASKLNFRAGVSKTFILLSCSNCDAINMRIDYTSILQYMLEEGVNLHILTDVEFDFERTRKLRHFFGLDKSLIYSKRFPEGDAETRRQLHIPRNNFGVCIPLALGTNGSVFSARRLQLDQRFSGKRFFTIFAKRIAKSATPSEKQTCECSGYNNGVSYMTCSPSLYPDDNTILEDYDFELEDWELKHEDGKIE